MADQTRFGFGQYVSDLELDRLSTQAHDGEANAHVDAGVVGVLDGLEVTEHYVGTTPAQNLSVDVAAGAARDNAGLRIPLVGGSNVNCAVDHLGASTAVGAGNHRCLSIFAKQSIVQTQVFTKKSGGSIYRAWTEAATFEVWMGAETLLAAALDYPVLMAGYVLLADVTLINGQTQILTGDISTARRQDLLKPTGADTPHAVKGLSVPSAVVELAGGLNGLIADLLSTGPGTSDAGATLVGTADAPGTPVSLVGITVEAQIAELLAQINSLRTPPTARVARAASQAVNPSGFVSWDTEDWDSESMFDVGSPTKIALPRIGRYLVVFEGQFSYHADGYRELNIFRYDTTGVTLKDQLAAVQSRPNVASFSNRFVAVGMTNCTLAGDVIICFANQTSLSSLNFTGQCSVVRVGD